MSAVPNPSGSEALEVQVVDVLRARTPDTYCDACLAFILGVPLLVARQAAIGVASQGLAFERAVKTCAHCARSVELTCAR